MKFSAAVTASIVVAASTMSHANASLNVMSDKASLAAKDAAKALMDSRRPTGRQRNDLLLKAQHLLGFFTSSI